MSFGEVVKNGAGATLLKSGAAVSDDGPATHAQAITPIDETPVTMTGIRGVWVGTGGDLCVLLDGVNVVLKNVPDGTLIPISPTFVFAENTTAADVVLLG
jgi:hypothetical protein